MQRRRVQHWCLIVAAAGALLASVRVLGSPHFLIEDLNQWEKALGTQQIEPMGPLEWEMYMGQWQEFRMEGEPYPPNTFVPALLVPWSGGEGAPEVPADAGLIMAWVPTGLPGDYASAWMFNYLQDPDLTNTTITVTVTPPQFNFQGTQVTVVSFGIRSANGAVRAWFWNCGPAGPLPWNVPTTITINPAVMGLNAANPPATGFMNNPVFNLTQSMTFIVDENARWVGGPLPVPPPGMPIPAGLWNYWHNLIVTPKIQGKPPLPTKWSQPPVQVPGLDPPVFIGWDEPSNYEFRPIAADDWLCTDARPVTDIHWWGSFLGWDQPNPPQLPMGFHIGIWTDVPADDLNPYSHPGVLIWENFCDTYTWNFAGWDRDPFNTSPDHQESCFQFNQDIPPEQWFYQDPQPNGQRIYWLSIAARWGGILPQHPWGWKTRPHFFQDDASLIFQVSPDIWPPLLESKWLEGVPIVRNGVSWDLSFELTTVEEPRTDWGDAPDPPYPTLAINNGPLHPIIPGMLMGPLIDGELNGQPTPAADGDDLNPAGLFDDEDGVVFTSPLVTGQLATVDVTVSLPLLLDAWVDFDGDGNWAQPPDHIFGAMPLAPGLNTLAFAVPPGNFAGMTYARFRVSTLGGLPPTGPGPDGEVEDYQVKIQVPPMTADLGDAPDSSNSFAVGMSAYPPGPLMGVPANFPTVYQIGSPPFGPIHAIPRAVAWLGPKVTLETEADLGPDQDLVTNLQPPAAMSNRDLADDGLRPPLTLPLCRKSVVKYRVFVAVPPPMPMFVNVWFDWNRDGDWDDTLQCPQGLAPAPEWAIQNQVVPAGAAVGMNNMVSPPFLPWHPAPGAARQPIWMRITLSEKQWNPSPLGIVGDGGSGPQPGYLFGETEDYYFAPFLRFVRADFDEDGDVDKDDYLLFQSCASGPDIPRVQSELCERADLDPDNDVDQLDFGRFQECYSGEDEPVPEGCAEEVAE